MRADAAGVKTAGGVGGGILDQSPGRGAGVVRRAGVEAAGVEERGVEETGGVIGIPVPRGIHRVVDAGEFPDAALLDEDRAAGIPRREMGFIHTGQGIELDRQQFTDPVAALGDGGHFVDSPTRGPDGGTMQPPFEFIGDRIAHLRALGSAATGHHQFRAGFATATVKLRPLWERAVDLIDAQIRPRHVVVADALILRVQRIGYIRLPGEEGTLHESGGPEAGKTGQPDMPGGDEMTRADGGAEEIAEKPLILPPRVRISPARRGGVMAGIGRVIKEHCFHLRNEQTKACAHDRRPTKRDRDHDGET